MKHVDDETLAMLAVSDEVAEDAVAEHLASCATCRDEVAAIQRVAAVTRSSSDVELTSPPERVWDLIAATIAATPERLVAPSVVDDPAAVHDSPAVVDPVAGRAHAAPRRRPRRRRRVVALVLSGVGVLAVLLGIGVVSGVVPGLSGGGSETVLASTALDALPAWKGSSGTAELERDRDGRLTLVVDLRSGDDQPGAGGLREVWMMRSDLKGLVSVGFLDGDRGRFTVPSGMDTARFPVVDVSAEADDGNPEHSGDSIVRGRLSPS